jgi:hypothetical protein
MLVAAFDLPACAGVANITAATIPSSKDVNHTCFLIVIIVFPLSFVFALYRYFYLLPMRLWLII